MRVNYVLSGVTTGLRRNITMTVAMILTTAISLALLGSGLLLFRKVNDMKDYVYYRVEVSIFLKKDISAADRDHLRQQLQDDPLVKSFTYESKEAAYRRFREQFKDSPDLINNTRSNALPESFRVKLKDPTKYDLAASKYSSADGVEQVIDQRKILGKLFSIIGGIQAIAVVIAIVVLIAAVLLIGNTIQVAAFNRRREIEIMRLVGASNWYVQLPFVLEAVAAGLVGAIVAVCLLLAGKVVFIDRKLSVLFAPKGIIPTISFGDILSPGVGPLLLLVAAVLSALTAWVTLRFYVRL